MCCYVMNTIKESDCKVYFMVDECVNLEINNQQQHGNVTQVMFAFFKVAFIGKDTSLYKKKGISNALLSRKNVIDDDRLNSFNNTVCSNREND